MQQIIQAIFEKGVLRPLVPVDLAESELVLLAIERQNGQNSVEPANPSDDEWLDKAGLSRTLRRLGWRGKLWFDTTISLDRVADAT